MKIIFSPSKEMREENIFENSPEAKFNSTSSLVREDEIYSLISFFQKLYKPLSTIDIVMSNLYFFSKSKGFDSP